MSRPARRAFLRKDVLGWCAFDFANSSYTTVITTAAFSLYFREAVVGASNASGDLYWSLSGVAVNVILIMTSPVLGALADFSGRKKALLGVTVAQTVGGCALLALVGPGDVWLAVVVYVIATVGFEGGYVFYNAFLPEITDASTSGRVSALAWGLGFIGGLVSLVACAPFIGAPLTDASGAVDPSSAAGYRTAFLVVAGFFLVFAIPTFLWLKESPALGSLPRWRDHATVGFRRVGNTLSHLRRYRETAKYVVGYLFFFGGVNVVIKFAAIFASRSFGIKGSELVLLFIFTNIVAVPGTLAAGWLADRIGQKIALIMTLVLWTGVAVTGALAHSKPAFWAMAAGAAIGMGSTQSIARSYMAMLVPRDRETEFFGFYVMAGQVGSILSFLVFGMVSAGSGDQRLAVLWTVPFFAVGLAFIAWINEARARSDLAARS